MAESPVPPPATPDELVQITIPKSQAVLVLAAVGAGVVWTRAYLSIRTPAATLLPELAAQEAEVVDAFQQIMRVAEQRSELVRAVHTLTLVTRGAYGDTDVLTRPE